MSDERKPTQDAAAKRGAKTSLVVITLVTIALLSSCASPEPPRVVPDIRSDLEEVQNDDRISRHAPVQLYEAEKAVERLERAADRDQQDRIDHLAYLARHQIELARVAAETEAYQERIEELAQERDEARLEAATSRAERASRRAEELRSQLTELDTRQTDRGLIVTMSDVLFALDEAELQPAARDALEQVAGLLQEYPDRKVIVEGHTDSLGSEQYNRELSRRRAAAVARVLERNGVSSNRLEVRGLGESRPIAPNDSKAGRLENRRVEIVLQRTSGSGSGSRAGRSDSDGSARPEVSAGPP
ncbi:MAG: OmpA family protein [bacterium]